MPSVIDSYDAANQDFEATLYSDAVTGGPAGGYGQCFTGNGYKIVDARFYLKRQSLPPGNITAKLWEMTGTFGVNGLPGALLATSDSVAALSVVPGTFGQTLFPFSGVNQYVTVNGTHYVITLEYTVGDGSNYIIVGMDSTTATHPGTWVFHSAETGGAWNSVDAGFDLIFYVDGDPVVVPVVEAPQYTGGSRPRFRKLLPHEKRYREELMKRFKVSEEPEELETIRILAEFLGRL